MICVKSIVACVLVSNYRSNAVLHKQQDMPLSQLLTFCAVFCIMYFQGHEHPHISFKNKIIFTLVQALRLCTGRKAHRGNKGIAVPFLDHGTRRG